MFSIASQRYKRQLPFVKLRKMAYVFSGLTAVMLLGLVLLPSFLPPKSNAAPGVASTPTISLPATSSVSFSLNPGTFNSVSQDFTVSTTNYTGYTLSIATTGDSTALVNTTNDNKTIDSITGTKTSNQFDVGWGYSTDGTNFQGAPSTSASGDTINSTEEPNTTADSYTLTFGAKVDQSIAAGSYTNSFNISATANETGYVITYNANAGDDTVTNMPSPNPQESTISGTTVYLSNDVPKRQGYVFLGWSEDDSATEASFDAGGTFTLDPDEVAAKTLYAVWKETNHILFQGNGLKFDDDSTENDVEYYYACHVEPVDPIAYSHSSNITDDGERTGGLSGRINTTEVKTIEGASKLHIKLTYGTYRSARTSAVVVWEGNNPDYTVNSNYSTGIMLDGTNHFYGGGGTTPSNIEGDIEGDTVTIGYYDSVASRAYGYYAVITGLDSDGNVLSINKTVCSYKPAFGNYKEPIVDTKQTFLGWAEDQEAYFPDYETAEDIQNNIQFEDGETKTLYAIWANDYCPNNNICYRANNPSAEGEMSNQSASPNSTVTLIAPNYSLKDYGFAGWNTEADGSGTTYGPNEDITTDDLYPRGMKLFAIWIPKSTDYTMQTFTATQCNTMADGDIIALEDERDGQVYSIVKILKHQGESNEYGECWMMENLRLNPADSNTAITTSNTNHPTDTFVNNDLKNISKPYFKTEVNRDSATYDRLSFGLGNITGTNAAYTGDDQTTRWYSYGVMYNWYTATAGNGTYNWTSDRTGGDICPSGWHLPTGKDTSGDFGKLDVALGGTGGQQSSGAASLRWRTYPLNFVYSGYYMSSSAYNRGRNGYYWSSIMYAGYHGGYSLALGDTFAYPISSASNGSHGNPVRCLANVSEESFTLTYNANGGSSAPDSQSGTSASRSYAFALSTSTPNNSGLTFAGWARSASASEAEYQPGEIFDTPTTSTTLYAVWKPNVTIVFDPSGGTGAMANMGIPSGKSKSLNNNTFSKSGYSFVGWSTTEGSNTVAYNNSASYTAPTVTEDTTVTLYAVWGRSRTITYNGNSATDGAMSQTHSTSENASVSLYAPNFYRTGYGFAGWSTDSSAQPGGSSTIYGPNATITVPEYSGSDSSMKLYAVWVPSAGNLQGFSCSTLSDGQVTALTDIRDNNVYTVGKQADGNCWMMENLRLDPAGKTLDSSNTNNPTSDFSAAVAALSSSTFATCTTRSSDCFDQFSAGLGNLTGTTANPTSSGQTYRWYSYGGMYNWYTATAGNGTYGSDSYVVADGDICPSGWHLPYGGSGTGKKGGDTDGGFYYLGRKLGAYAENVAASSDAWRSYPINFVNSGYYEGSTASGRGSAGLFWSSSSSYSKDYAYRTTVGGIRFYAGTYDVSKYYGQAVRCVAD